MDQMEDDQIGGDTPTGSADTPDEGYPVDEDDGIEDPYGEAPQPRAHHVRQKAGLPTAKAQAKQRKRIAKGSTRILVQQKRRQALELRKAGATYQQIADAVGYADAGAARKSVLKAMGEVIQEPVAELRTMQIERLNHMLMVVWNKVQAGDLSAMHTALSIMNKIDALMGTEAAQQVEVKNSGSILTVEGSKEDFIAALRKMAGAGIGPDGKNLTAQQVPSLPSGQAGGGSAPASHGSDANRYPPGMGVQVVEQVEEEVTPDDIVDAVLVDDPPPPIETKKKFSFGVDPTVRREKRA